MTSEQLLVIGFALGDVDVCDGQVFINPGGAGLVALLAKEKGYHTTLLTAISDDKVGQEVIKRLLRAGVEVKKGLNNAGPIPQRVRVHEGGRFSLTRIGRWDRAIRELELSGISMGFDKVIISDYGGGLAPDVSGLVKEKGCLFSDPKPSSETPNSYVDIATPSAIDYNISLADFLVNPEQMMRRLMRELSSRSVVLTFGELGAFFASVEEPIPVYLSYEQARLRDSSGVGDLFMISLCKSDDDVSLYERVMSAVVAVYHELENHDYVRPGLLTCQCAFHNDFDAQALEGSEDVRLGLRAGVAGSFDALHAGHLSILKRVKRLYSSVVAILDDDARVRRRKGNCRPIYDQTSRAKMLLDTGFVDEVVLFGDDVEFESLLLTHNINVVVKGSEYRGGFYEWRQRKCSWSALCVESFSDIHTSNGGE